MNAILLLAQRELKTYLNTTWGWTVLTGVLIVVGLLFNVFGLTERPRYSAEVLEDFFFYTSGTIIIAGLLLTMRHGSCQSRHRRGVRADQEHAFSVHKLSPIDAALLPCAGKRKQTSREDREEESREKITETRAESVSGTTSAQCPKGLSGRGNCNKEG